MTDDTTVTWAESTDPATPAFTEGVVLEAAVLRRPVRGRTAVAAIMAAAGEYYSRLAFTRETTDGDRSYLEWAAAGPTGTEMSGVTVLTRDAAGLIEHVAIHHRPLTAVLEFSREMGRRTAGIVPPGTFDDGA